MDERESKSQSPKPQISKMALASALLGILGVSVMILRLGFYRPWWSEFVARNIATHLGIVGLILGFVVLRRTSKRIGVITLLVLFCCFFLLLCFLFLPVLVLLVFARSVAGCQFLQLSSFFLSIGFLLSLFAIPVTHEWKSRSKGKFKGGTFATLGVVLGALLVGCWFTETCGPASLALRMACGTNLARLGKAMVTCARDNAGRYPEPDQWCDLLLQDGQVEADCFLCPGVKWEWRRQVFPWPVPKNERCYYAMNPNCEPNSPSDTVLLFEIKGGRDKFGGPELLTVDNHRGGGCNVLFNGGYIQFVSRKRIADLKWGVEEETHESIKQEGDSR